MGFLIAGIMLTLVSIELEEKSFKQQQRPMEQLNF
jgi:hypothetical protein